MKKRYIFLIIAAVLLLCLAFYISRTSMLEPIKIKLFGFDCERLLYDFGRDVESKEQALLMFNEYNSKDTSRTYPPEMLDNEVDYYEKYGIYVYTGLTLKENGKLVQWGCGK